MALSEAQRERKVCAWASSEEVVAGVVIGNRITRYDRLGNIIDSHVVRDPLSAGRAALEARDAE